MDLDDDLFGAFDGTDKVEEIEIQPEPKLKRKSDGTAAPFEDKGSEGQDGQNGDKGDDYEGASHKSKKSRVVGDEEMANETDLYKVQPTITQNQEITTADGRKVISFSAYPANYVAPPVSQAPCPLPSCNTVGSIRIADGGNRHLMLPEG